MGWQQVIAVGNVGADPEIRQFSSGISANIRLAVTKQYRKDGERKEVTEWINCVVFYEKLVEVVEQYVTKGKEIMVVGELRTRSYEKDGQKRYVTEVVVSEIKLLGGVRSGSSGGGGGGESRSSGRSGSRSTGRSPRDEMDDEIPF